MKRAFGAMLFYMSLAALVLAQVSSDSSVSQEEREFLSAAHSRLSAEFAEQQQRDDAELLRLGKAEERAKQKLADASMMRRIAAKEAADTAQGHGQTTSQITVTHTPEAAETRLARAEDDEERARMELQRMDNERRITESMAREWAERRRGTHENLKRLRDQFSANPSRSTYQALEDQFQAAAKDNGIYCNVTWKTSPKPAAIISYQTKRSRERGEVVTSLKDVTETKESVLMGVYYVWATREGRPTSDPNRLVSITERNTVVTIVEDR